MTPSLEEDLYTSHYAALLRRNWLLVLATTVLGGLIGVVLVLFILPRQWRAGSSVLFGTSSQSTLVLPTNVPGLQSIASKLGLGQGTSGTQNMALAIGNSQSVRLEIIQRLGLVQKWKADGIYDADEKLRQLTSINLTDQGTMVVFVSASGSPRGIFPKADDDLAERTLARDIANLYVSIIQDKLNSLNLTESQRKANFLAERVEEVRKELDTARRALKVKEAQLGFIYTLPAPPPEIASLAGYEKDLAVAQADQQAAQDELAKLKGELTKQDLMILSNVVSTRSGIADHMSEGVAEAAADLAQLHSKGYSDETPECRDLLARIDTMQRTYADEVAKGLQVQSQSESVNPVRQALLQQIASLEGDRVAASARVSALSTATGIVRGRVAALPGAMEQVGALMQELQVKASVYEAITGAYEMARVEAAEEAPQFTVLDPAITPPRKMAPSGAKTCGALAAAGFVLGLILAPAWDRRRRRARPAPPDQEAQPSSP